MYCLHESFLWILSRWKLLEMLLFMFFRFIVLTKVTHYILFFKQKVIHYILCQLYFFKQIFEQKFIALNLNGSFLCSLLCFLDALRYLYKVCVFFCPKYLDKKNNNNKLSLTIFGHIIFWNTLKSLKVTKTFRVAIMC